MITAKHSYLHCAAVVDEIDERTHGILLEVLTEDDLVQDVEHKHCNGSAQCFLQVCHSQQGVAEGQEGHLQAISPGGLISTKVLVKAPATAMQSRCMILLLGECAQCIGTIPGRHLYAAATAAQH